MDANDFLSLMDEPEMAQDAALDENASDEDMIITVIGGEYSHQGVVDSITIRAPSSREALLDYNGPSLADLFAQQGVRVRVA